MINLLKQSLPKNNIINEANNSLFNQLKFKFVQALRELKAIAEALGQAKLWKPTNLKGTRWLPHIEKALNTLVNNFQPVVAHMEHTVTDGGSSATMEGRAVQVTHILKDHRQMLYLHLYQDILAVLKW